MTIFTSHSADETEQIAENFAKRLVPGDTIAYRGNLGAGKTAFTRGLARGLGIACDVTSPTFAILNVYSGTDKMSADKTSANISLYHFDMYRVQGLESLESTGFFDYLDGENILAVEWSENIADELPENAITVTLIPESENIRRIEIDGGGRF